MMFRLKASKIQPTGVFMHNSHVGYQGDTTENVDTTNILSLQTNREKHTVETFLVEGL